MKAPIEADRLNPMPSKIAGERGLIGAATDRPSPAQTSTRRLLGVRRERPCCRAVEQRDELATQRHFVDLGIVSTVRFAPHRTIEIGNLVENCVYGRLISLGV